MRANRLITPIPSAGTAAIDSKMISPMERSPERAAQGAIAQLLPSVARRFPVFAPLWTRAGVSFRDQGLAKAGSLPMKIKASGCAASILATALFVCFAGPSPAATGTDGSKSVKHYRHYVHHGFGRVVVKSSDSKPEPATDTAENDAVNP